MAMYPVHLWILLDFVSLVLQKKNKSSLQNYFKYLHIKLLKIVKIKDSLIVNEYDFISLLPVCCLLHSVY